MTKKLKPEDIINVGFGWCYLLKNGEEVWRQDDNAIWGFDGDSETPWDRCQDIEAIAKKDLSARYLLIKEGAMTAQIFERFETGWIEIRNMFGFADDESAEAFEEELEKVKASKTLTFLA